MSSPTYKSRSRSPRRHDSGHIRERRRSTSRRRSAAKDLPLGAKPLSRHDLETYRPLFALYLDIQKHLDLEELPQDEVKGRWKSFMNKWNRGELAEGWYDPKTLDKAIESLGDRESPQRRMRYEDVSEDDDEYGPAAPKDGVYERNTGSRPYPREGPTIPNMQDLRVRQEQAEEDAISAREQRVHHLQQERRADRKQQKDRLDELVPRSEPGSRERQLEKKREVAESNRSFAASKDAADVEVPESDVMGDEDSLAQLKGRQREQERKKNEREIRREEALRARRAEVEERLAGMREKEAKTMDMLKEIAKARFGA